jgi:hypothetical protein
MSYYLNKSIAYSGLDTNWNPFLAVEKIKVKLINLVKNQVIINHGNEKNISLFTLCNSTYY